jgi:predicted ATPase
VQLVAAGKSNSAIAERLVLSERTIENHVAAIYRRLGIGTRVELAAAFTRDHPTGRIAYSKPAHNLPVQATQLIGRETELQEVSALLGQTRLLTVAGPGGVGKTRLALEVGVGMLGVFPDGVWFFDFGPHSSSEPPAAIVAAALGIRESDDPPGSTALTEALRRRGLLLILDNCERVVAESAALADAILRACPQVRILATSREVLNLAGECVYELLPLQCPPSETQVTAEDALGFGSVALFAKCAHTADRLFELNDRNARLVSDICRQIDGLPLAIELAAARAKVLGLPNLAKQLDMRLRILTCGLRSAPLHHQTMRGAIDWSYDLLSETERVLFRRLAIFAGGWALPAAEFACTDAQLAIGTIVDLLSGLVHKSLVVVERDREEPRYRMLDSIREYALEKLDAFNERPAMARRHAQWVADLAERVDTERWSGSRRRWLVTIAPEDDNVRAALRWALESQDGLAVGGRIAAGFGAYWYSSSRLPEGRRWIESALQKLGDRADDALAARLLQALARLLFGERRLDTARRASALFERLNDRRSLASSCLTLASATLSSTTLHGRKKHLIAR